jgi:hypothetical protein
MGCYEYKSSLGAWAYGTKAKHSAQYRTRVTNNLANMPSIVAYRKPGWGFRSPCFQQL